MARRKKKPKQLALYGPGRGGHKNSGRKPHGERAGVPHRARAALASRFPVHVTVKLLGELPSIRRKEEYRVLFGAFEKAAERNGMRLVHYSIQRDHVHLMTEARDASALSRGMQGLTIRMAKGLNRLWERKGKVFADRYHARILKTPTEVRNALRYLFKNAYKHKRVPSRLLDPFSSARWFDGWRGIATRSKYLNPLAQAHTWLLGTGWRRLGLLRASPG